MKKRLIFIPILILALVLALVTVPVSAADGDVVLVDFGPTPRTPSIEGTISHDGSNLNFSVTVLGQDAADDDYLAFWIDPDYLNKDLSGMSNQFDSPWNEHNKLLMLNFYRGNTNPKWGDGTGGSPPWMQTGVLPPGVSLTYTDTDDGMNWGGTIPFSVLGINLGDTFGYMFAVRIKTDAKKYVNGYPEMVYGYTPGWDLRDYALVTIPVPEPEPEPVEPAPERSPKAFDVFVRFGYDSTRYINGALASTIEAAGLYNDAQYMLEIPKGCVVTGTPGRINWLWLDSITDGVLTFALEGDAEFSEPCTIYIVEGGRLRQDYWTGAWLGVGRWVEVGTFTSIVDGEAHLD